MRTKLLTLVLLLCFSMTYGQKVKIKNTRIWVEYASMPLHKTSPDERTYSLEVTGSYKFDKQEIGDALNLRGWTYVEDGGTVLAKLKVSDFVRGTEDYKTVKKSKKNKDGTETKWTEYVYSSQNTGLAYLKVYGPSNKYVPLKNETKSSSKKAKKKAEADKAKADNPFLKGVETAPAEEEVVDNEQVASYDLTQRYSVAGESNKSAKVARSSYRATANESYARQVEQYSNVVIARTNQKLNYTYGYNKRSDRAKFKTLASKKHPEYEMFKNATDALKAIFKTKKFNKPMDEVVASMEPLIGYFKSVADKYGADDKHEKRLKSASLYNLAQLYYYLDMPDKVVEVGNEYIAWDHNAKMGKNFVSKGEKLKHLLDFHDVTGRYFVTDEDSDAIEGEELEADEEEEEAGK